ncbi:integral membrane protein, partial [Mycobacterium rhizamassiliense]|jgi:hypothetical protein
VPWWTALLFAVTTTAIGYGIDAGSGHKQLTSVFAVLYIAGCVAAVLAVRQDGLFSAVIQPPLILFCAVPGAYWLFHGGQLGNIKDLLINCGYPLIERFPLMLGTAGGILALGLIRWYFGMSYRPAAGEDGADEKADSAAPAVKSFFLSGIGAKLNSLLGVGSDEDDEPDEASPTDAKRARPSRPSQRGTGGTARPARNGRSGARSGRAGSGRTRPPLDDERDPAAEPRRRRRPPRDFDPADPPRRSGRRPRPQDDSDPRGQSPREGRGYRGPYERSAPRGGRYDDYDRYESSGGARRFAPQYESYDSYEPPSEPRRRRPAPNGANGSGPSHHPISQVRYRGSDEERAERRSRPRAQSPSRADSWEYDA